MVGYSWDVPSKALPLELVGWECGGCKNGPEALAPTRQENAKMVPASTFIPIESPYEFLPLW